jgi:hypothetical protein
MDNSGNMNYFGLEPSNVDMEVFGQRVQEKKVEEEEGDDDDPQDQE